MSESIEMDDVLTVTNKIEAQRKELREERGKLEAIVIKKAKAISDYAREVAIMEIKLKNGAITKWGDLTVGKVTASAARKIAEGICWKELLAKEEAEGLYKAAVENLMSIRAELNGLQSISRHLE
jgi:hypothetical protein